MTKRKRRRRRLDVEMASALSEATDRLEKLDWESDQDTKTLVGRQITRLGSRIIRNIKTEEIHNPRMCALACGLVSMFFLRLAEVPEDEHEDFFLLLMREYQGLDKWMSSWSTSDGDGEDDEDDDDNDDEDGSTTVH